MKNNLLGQEKKTEKFITSSVPIEKEVIRIDKKREGITKTVSYRLQLDSKRFTVTSLSNLVQTLHKEFIKLNVINTNTMIKNVKLAKLIHLLSLIRKL